MPDALRTRIEIRAVTQPQAVHVGLRRDADLRVVGVDEDDVVLLACFCGPRVDRPSRSLRLPAHTVAVIHCSSFCFGAAPT